MKFRDTLSGSLREFVSIKGNRIRLFVCGPTVYDLIHMGNARTFVFFDMLARYLRMRGFEVFYLQNITDVDDKIIKKAEAGNIDWRDVADRYYSEYLTDCLYLGITSVNLHARATNYIDRIISQIRRLIRRGYAYVSDDGVYYDTSKFSDYGKLSKQKLDRIRHGARVDVRESKRKPEDFALWKFSDGHPSWDSPWGKGRPGWHIEDTAITETYFGSEYDIHGGAVDLIFPHHEAEIAQMRAISGRRFLSRYWIHISYLLFDSGNVDKMSKSLGNVVTVRELSRKYSGEELRYFLLNSRYSSELLFSEPILKSSSEGWKRLQKAFSVLSSMDLCNDMACAKYPPFEKVIEAMENNLDSREAIAFLHQLASSVFQGDLSTEDLHRIYHTFLFANGFLGIFRSVSGNTEMIIKQLIELRNRYRKAGKFDVSDDIRNSLMKAGVKIEDSGGDTTWMMIG
ncbi:MAG: cysteine--tRNA ligase [Candidatus Thermoplasmatota archaeon]|nr:cysteine--tRNA ligase [Candidatus Thermoplasmatota archaeon]MCL5730863.1 cysteine--tRNA ligase [Candidatus Thermoplasmatota archaeon]